MGFEIIGQASNGYDAIDLIERLKPDVVITDIRMPFVDGIQLSKYHPHGTSQNENRIHFRIR